MKISLWVASFSRNATYTESEGRLFRRLHENKNDSTTACCSVVMSPGNDFFFFQNKVTKWYNPEQTSYSFQSGRCTFGNGSFGLQPKIGLALNGTANLFPYRKSRFHETGRTETLRTRFRCVTTWFNVTRYSSSSVTKLLLIDTFGYIDRNSWTSSLDSREQKETSSSFKCLHCFSNLRKKKTRKQKQWVNTFEEEANNHSADMSHAKKHFAYLTGFTGFEMQA